MILSSFYFIVSSFIDLFAVKGNYSEHTFSHSSHKPKSNLNMELEAGKNLETAD